MRRSQRIRKRRVERLQLRSEVRRLIMGKRVREESSASSGNDSPSEAGTPRKANSPAPQEERQVEPTRGEHQTQGKRKASLQMTGMGEAGERVQRPVIRRTSPQTDAKGIADNKDEQALRSMAQRRVDELVRKILGPQVEAGNKPIRNPVRVRATKHRHP